MCIRDRTYNTLHHDAHIQLPGSQWDQRVYKQLALPSERRNNNYDHNEPGVDQKLRAFTDQRKSNHSPEYRISSGLPRAVPADPRKPTYSRKASNRSASIPVVDTAAGNKAKRIDQCLSGVCEKTLTARGAASGVRTTKLAEL